MCENDTLVQEYKQGEYTIEIHRDDMHDESPREWENLGTMVCWHNQYNLGDRQPDYSPEEYFRNFQPSIMLNLFLYDHSGITMQTTPFSCQWDSGQVGYIYVSIADIKKEYNWKLLTQQRREKIERYLRQEVKTYNDYLTGNVYGYIIKDSNDEDVESCWGFYGDYDKFCLSEAKDCVTWLMDHKDE